MKKEEKQRRLKDVNGWRIYKVWNPDYLDCDICYDVCDEDDEIANTFRTLEDAQAWCR